MRGPLRHPPDAQPVPVLDATGARFERSGENREQRRLACAVRPDERDGLALGELEIGRLERDKGTEAARDADRAKQRQGVAARAGASGGASTSTTSTGTSGSSPSHVAKWMRSAKNSQIARAAASSGNATSTPGSP